MILVKICGITNWPDAKAACDAGADMLGFNFYEKSLRRVSTVEAATMRAKLPSGVQAVGLFVYRGSMGQHGNGYVYQQHRMVLTILSDRNARSQRSLHCGHCGNRADLQRYNG